LDNQADESGEEDSEEREINSEEEKYIKLYKQPRREHQILQKLKNENLEQVAKEYELKEKQYDLEREEESF
jgi:hypothetical protein